MEQVSCQQCRTVNPTGSSFCNGCGGALAPESGQAAGPEQSAAAAHGATRPADAVAPTGWALAMAGIDAAPDVDPNSPPPLRTSDYASWGARLGAYLLDSIIVMCFLGLVLGGVYVLGVALDRAAIEDLGAWIGDGALGDPSDDAVPWLLIGVAAILVAYVWWEVWWIRSPRFMARPGQLLAGFRVVRAEEAQPVTTARSVGRMAAKLGLSAAIGWIWMVICAFTIGLSNRRQSLHDMIAGTACVKKDALARRGIGPDAASARGADAARQAASAATVSTTSSSVPGSPPATPPPGSPPAPPSGPFM